MSVEVSANFVYHQFRADIARDLSVDGYFTARGQVTGDASGGSARITLREGTDGSLQNRALQLKAVYAQKSATIGDGVLLVIGKASGDSEQNDEEAVELVGVGPFSGTVITYHARGAGNISDVLRSRGWYLPSFGLGNQDLILDFYWPNDAGATVWTAKCYGYYYMLRL